MRCIGVDYGSKRTGLSYGDDLGVATPLACIASADSDEMRAELGKVIAQRRITDVVLGHPLNMDGTSGPKAREVEELARRIRDELGVAVHLIDERLTTEEAQSTIAPKRRRSLRASGIIDSRAATIILQDFLDNRTGPGPLAP